MPMTPYLHVTANAYSQMIWVAMPAPILADDWSHSHLQDAGGVNAVRQECGDGLGSVENASQDLQ